MGDVVRIPDSNKKFSNKKLTSSNTVTSSEKLIYTKTLKHLKNIRLEGGSSGQLILFLVKIVVLDIVRRYSKRKCPFVWRGLQALQVLVYPPFKWIQRWKPLGNLIKGIQIFSRPLMLISLATTFLKQSRASPNLTDCVDDSQCLGSTITQTSSEIINSAESVGSSDPDNQLLQLRNDLENHGITLPERITDDELHRFYTAADGDFSCFLISIKRTIRWRETYNILSLEELEMWSHLVFWHDTDVELRPCLVIRFGLACSSVKPHDRPHFSQAINCDSHGTNPSRMINANHDFNGSFLKSTVSQMEHGVLYLVKEDDPRITVVMDCEGLSALSFPVQMIRSCCAVMQDHYPDRLATMFVVRLPSIGRVLTKTLLQILKPNTRAKLRIEGEKTYTEALASLLKTVPAFLGGKCTCQTCCTSPAISRRLTKKASRSDDIDGSTIDLPSNGDYEQFLRAFVFGVLMLWIIVALLIGMHEPSM